MTTGIGSAGEPDDRSPAGGASYGNWVAHRSPGLGPLSFAGSAAAVAAALGALIALMLGGPRAGLVWGAYGLVTFAGVGTPAGPWAYRRLAWWWHRHRGGHRWLAGPDSPNPDPGLYLPGLLGVTGLIEATDADGAPFAVLTDRACLITVVARCAADGPAMCDTSTVDAWVAGWARLLAAAAADPALVAIKAVIESRPDNGATLAANVARARRPGGPPLAAAVLDEITTCYPTVAAHATTWVEFTYRTRHLPGATRVPAGADRDTLVHAELARRIPGLLAGLRRSGAGTVTMATAAQLTRVVRDAYNPTDTRPDVARPDAAAPWAYAGPTTAEEAWGHYRHQDACSVTWAMTDLPRAPITATAAAGLFGALPGLAGKRVALVLRPHTPARSARAAERDATTAVFTATGGRGKGRVAATGAARCRATEQTRHEIATGAVLVDLQLYVTATVTHPDLLPDAAAAVAAAGTVPIRLTRCTGAQAAAFATTLPAGFLPDEHTVLPRWIKDLT